MIKKPSFLRGLSVLIPVLACLPAPAAAQWAWAKKVSVSVESHWRGFAMDTLGNYYFAGISDKFPAPAPRAFVVAKYGADTTLGWDARMYGPATISTEAEVDVDAAGNVYAISTFKGTITRPDSTTLASVADACIIVKYDSKGQHQWSKVLGADKWAAFKVHSDGTLGLHIPNFMAGGGRVWGDTTFSLASGDGYLEISADGKLLSVTALSAFASVTGIRWLESPAPGKLRAVVGASSTFANTPNFIKLVDMDLATKAVTARADSAKIVRSVSGGIDLEHWFFEEKTGHLFVIANTREGFLKVNDKDSLGPWLNNLTRVYHLLEFNAKMEVVNRFMHSSPRFFAVRDSQIVIQALAHRTAGFYTDHGTIATKGPTDGQITYVIDRNMKYKRKAFVEAPASGNNNVTPRGLVIDAKGEVYLGLQAGYTVNYPRVTDVISLSAPLATSAAIFVVSKLGDSASVGILGRSSAGQRQARIQRLAFGKTVRIERQGAFRYDLADLSGKSMVQGKGKDGADCDVSRLASGLYWIRIQAGDQRETLGLTIE